MSDHSSRRKLPPLSPKSTSPDGEDAGETVNKRKKKRSARARSEDGQNATPRERSSSKKRESKSADRNSHVGDQENVDPASVNQSQVKKKKKKKKPPSASREELVSGEEVLSDQGNTGQKPKKKKKKKKKAPVSETEEEDEEEVEVGLAAELGDIKEDVIVTDKADQVKHEEATWAQPAMRSEAMNSIYIEKKDGFKTADKHKLARKREDQMARYRDLEMAEPPSQSTIQLALTSHRIFKTSSVYLQGLLCGFAFWQIVNVYMLSNNGFDVFLEYYYLLAMAVQSIYFFLLAISTVAVFDRYDIGRPTQRSLRRAFAMQSGAIACFFYFAGLVISTSIAATDDKISLYKEDSSLWENEEERDAELSTWLILNLVRGLCVIIGWAIIALRPNTDRLSKNLIKADENMLMEEPTNLNSLGNGAA